MFYSALHVWYALLLCLALWLNRADVRTLALCLIVGADVFIVLPWTHPASLWYFEWFLIELVVILAAITLRSPTSWAVAVFAAIEAAIDLMGMCHGPVAGIGPYRVVMPLLETGQLLICVLLSHSARAFYQRRLWRNVFERLK